MNIELVESRSGTKYAIVTDDAGRRIHIFPESNGVKIQAPREILRIAPVDYNTMFIY